LPSPASPSRLLQCLHLLPGPLRCPVRVGCQDRGKRARQGRAGAARSKRTSNTATRRGQRLPHPRLLQLRTLFVPASSLGSVVKDSHRTRSRGPYAWAFRARPRHRAPAHHTHKSPHAGEAAIIGPLPPSVMKSNAKEGHCCRRERADPTPCDSGTKLLSGAYPEG
jgi:hypothetical protein